jgi:hypothetical protein
MVKNRFLFKQFCMITMFQPKIAVKAGQWCQELWRKRKDDVVSFQTCWSYRCCSLSLWSSLYLVFSMYPELPGFQFLYAVVSVMPTLNVAVCLSGCLWCARTTTGRSSRASSPAVFFSEFGVNILSGVVYSISSPFDNVVWQSSRGVVVCSATFSVVIRPNSGRLKYCPFSHCMNAVTNWPMTNDEWGWRSVMQGTILGFCNTHHSTPHHITASTDRFRSYR